MAVGREIILRQEDRPVEGGVEGEVIWFCRCLGIAQGRDIERVASRIIIALLSAGSQGEGITVEEIAHELAVSPARVNHHIRRLSSAGIVYRERKRIFIRGRSLVALVREIRKDALRILDDLEVAAGEIDREYGILHREARKPEVRGP
ncbi:MAG: winged helix-turn-helix domain-containing protein [Methanolinea sp.]|nr:winged helix-turn-helix domain-containing protein [Methanolinea sp.]